MDIHRCRFIPYPPHAINALAFSHNSVQNNSRSPPDLRLALGRGNGDIEIWNPLGGDWYQETILRGGKDSSIEGLVWTLDNRGPEHENQNPAPAGKLRLFSIGLSSSVTEWDVALGVPVRHAEGNYGEIWCIAAQPTTTPPMNDDALTLGRESSTQSQNLAAGCADGTIVLFSTEDNDLRYMRTLAKPPTKKPRTLSITWRDLNTVVAGYSDSTIRVYDVRSRTSVRNMSLGRPGDGGSETLVWSVKCLPDGSVVSGDSSGELKIWDPKNFSLVQRLQSHQADILDIVTNTAGDTIITGGADRRTTVYKLSGTRLNEKRQRWAKIMHRRFHQHDVKAIAAFESMEMSVLISGGPDTIPVVVPLRNWQSENYRSLPNLPQQPQVSSAARSRLLLTWWDRELSIWHIPKSRNVEKSTENRYCDSQNHEIVSKIILAGNDNITSAHISDDGRLVAVATLAGVRVFRLRKRLSSRGIAMRAHQVELPTALGKFGSRLLRFSVDCHWLCVVRSNNTINIAKILPTESSKDPPTVLDQVVKLTRPSRKYPFNGLGEYLHTVSSLAFSADSRILAIGDVSGHVDYWILEGHEDILQQPIDSGAKKSSSLVESSSEDDSSDEDEDLAILHGQRWIRSPAHLTLPCLDSSIIHLSFRPQKSRESQKTVMNGDIGLHATRQNPNPLSHELPAGEARVMAITARNHLFEFDVLRGQLSDWSRRNPPEYLPQAFLRIRDRAMGSLWDIRGKQEGLWLYGFTWLFFLNLSEDFPRPGAIGRLGHYDVLDPLENSQKRKRKRKSLGDPVRAKQSSGAGGPINPSEIDIGTGQTLQKFRSGKRKEWQIVALQAKVELTADGENAYELPSSTLALARRGEVEGSMQSQLPNGHHETLVGGHTDLIDNEELGAVVDSEEEKRKGWWHTFTYRSIFGMVAVGDEPASQENQEKGGDCSMNSSLEVAVIERPLWDLQLPPRYDGGQDWET